MDTHETSSSPVSDRRIVLLGLSAAAATLASGARAASRGESNTPNSRLQGAAQSKSRPTSE